MKHPDHFTTAELPPAPYVRCLPAAQAGVDADALRSLDPAKWSYDLVLQGENLGAELVRGRHGTAAAPPIDQIVEGTLELINTSLGQQSLVDVLHGGQLACDLLYDSTDPAFHLDYRLGSLNVEPHVPRYLKVLTAVAMDPADQSPYGVVYTQSPEYHQNLAPRPGEAVLPNMTRANNGDIVLMDVDNMYHASPNLPGAHRVRRLCEVVIYQASDLQV